MSPTSQTEGETEPTVIDLTSGDSNAGDLGDDEHQRTEPGSLIKTLAIGGAALVILVLGLIAFDSNPDAIPPPQPTPEQATPATQVPSDTETETVSESFLGFSDILVMVANAVESGTLENVTDAGPPPSVVAIQGDETLCTNLRLEPSGEFGGDFWFELSAGGGVTNWAGRPPPLTPTTSSSGTLQPSESTFGALVYWRLSDGPTGLAGVGPEPKYLDSVDNLAAALTDEVIVVVDVLSDTVVLELAAPADGARTETADFSPNGKLLAITDDSLRTVVVDLESGQTIWDRRTAGLSAAWLDKSVLGLAEPRGLDATLVAVDVRTGAETQLYELSAGVPWSIVRNGQPC